MRKKRRILTGTAAFAMLLMAGLQVCAEENSGLNLYLSTWELEYFQPAITAFQEQYPDVAVEIETWDPYSASLFGQAEKLAARLMAGEGPDLLISENFPTQDIRKLMKAGVYAPLDEYMAQEDIWNDENFVMSVIDGGRFDGVQYVMPLSYTPLLMVSSEEAMQEAHLTEEECPDTLSLLKALAALYDTDYSERILADSAQLSFYPLCLDGNFLDYTDGTIGTDAQMLQEACEAYARMYEEDHTGTDHSGSYEECGTAIAGRRAYCYFTSYSGNLFAVLETAQGIAASETPAVVPLRNAQGESLVNLHAYAGIRANSENKQNAWRMLRLMMSEEAQRSYSSANQNYSVSRPILEEVIGNADIRLDEAFMEEYRNVVCNPQKCIFISDVVVSQFDTAMESFYYGEEDYEECMGAFEKFARIYLTE